MREPAICKPSDSKDTGAAIGIVAQIEVKFLKDHSDSLTVQDPLQSCADLLQSDPVAAAAQLRDFLAANPLNANGYRLLAAADRAISESQGSGGVVQSSLVSGASMRLEHAARSLESDDLETAEIILRHRLHQAPGDVEALRLLAMLATRLDYPAEGEELLRLALEFDPDYAPATLDLARELHQQNRVIEALALTSKLLERDADNEPAKALHAAALGRAGRFDESIRHYEDLIQRAPRQSGLWTSYGHILKTVGRSNDGLGAMRRAVEVSPHSGEGWWNLSNLKTVKFGSGEIATMEAALKDEGSSEDNRLHLHFALGKAFEDLGDAERAFAHYSAGNRIRHDSATYDPESVTRDVSAARRAFSREFFESRPGLGSDARDPIFIVGMPRSGSTLLEQILASHPDVEGTMELPDIPALAKGLGRGTQKYIPNLARMTPELSRSTGEEYLRLTRGHRTEGRLRFIDKMPNNWLHVPLIHMVLPKAKIIDARRHPMACGFSNFKQHFVRGQTFSNDLVWMGRYYSDYVRLMAHVDDVLPGRVHRVIHERLVESTESEIRQLLDYLELPFDDACLHFYENKRAIRTPSSEQVRRPIDRRGVDQWRLFEPFLDPLKGALGEVLTCYPAAPVFPAD